MPRINQTRNTIRFYWYRDPIAAWASLNGIWVSSEEWIEAEFFLEGSYYLICKDKAEDLLMALGKMIENKR